MEHDFSSRKLSRSIPKNTVNFLSKVKFDGVGIATAFDHIYSLNDACRYCKISNGNGVFQVVDSQIFSKNQSLVQGIAS